MPSISASGARADILGALERVRREQTRLSQKAMLARAGCSTGVWAKWLRGQSSPTVDRLERLACALGQRLTFALERAAVAGRSVKGSASVSKESKMLVAVVDTMPQAQREQVLDLALRFLQTWSGSAQTDMGQVPRPAK